MKTPKWTVLYNIVSDSSTWVGTGREFFDDEIAARRCYDLQVERGNCPTKRPYFHKVDWPHTGAVHRMGEE